ncbi:hypothetical protein Q7C36_012834 [Tachysurus vachellii]|uniref:Uncharacterized protein n=1 Tax=Tachysurus vachellii TaxID=175792 RepID=A0AA88MLY1_TACVA|nr:hypothetical protein Q7C36_012834 [Tachysurus vachellii]
MATSAPLHGDGSPSVRLGPGQSDISSASHGFGPGDSSVTFRHQSITDCSAAPCLISGGHCSNRDRDTPFDRPILFNTQTRDVKPVRSRRKQYDARFCGFSSWLSRYLMLRSRSSTGRGALD